MSRKALRINLSLSIAFIVYALLVFAAHSAPALLNLNDGFFFFNWFFIPLVASGLTLSWVVSARKATQLRVPRYLCAAGLALWAGALLLSYLQVVKAESIDILLNTQPIFAAALLLGWVFLALKEAPGRRVLSA